MNILSIKNTIIIAFAIIVCITTGGCSNEGFDKDITGIPIIIGAAPAATLSWVNGRAIGDEIEADMPESIGVFALREDYIETIFDNQPMYYRQGQMALDVLGESYIGLWPSENLWPYTPTKNWIGGKKYKFFGYAPYDNGTNIDLLDYSYSMSQFRRVKIPPISATEYVICQSTAEVEAGVKPTLEMVHLTSRLRFLFAIGQEYNRLRDIYVKSISITGEANNNHYYEVVVNMNAKTLDIQESLNDTFIPSEEIQLSLQQWEDPSKPGLKLQSSYVPFSSAYNLINALEYTTLTVTYDVYDKTGLLTRQDQVIRNRVNLSELTGSNGFQRGYCYDVKVLICPKYLYVLSGNDVQYDVLLDVQD